MASESRAAEQSDTTAAEELGWLGHYRVLGKLGKGGMGHVLRAEDVRLKRQVALKVMNKRFSSRPDSRQRFLDEARAVAAVHHDNVVTIFEVGETGGIPFMAMELLQGSTLQRWISEGKPQPTDWILKTAAQLVSGLAAAHQRGIIHRDIKPGNIWIQEPSGRAKVLDFGLALAAGPIDPADARGSVIGTPGYLSPEQARGEPLDDRSDLYSLGVVLYQLACGRLPLPAPTLPEQLIKILAHQPPRPDEVNPDVPAALADLIMRLLSKEPRDRFRSATALGEAIRQVSDELQRQSQAVAQIVLDPDAPANPRSPTKTGNRAGQGGATASAEQRRTVMKPAWAAAAVAVLALLIGVAAWSLRQEATVPPPPAPPTVAPGGVLAKTLDVLRLSDVPAATSDVTAGEQARFKVALANHATSPQNDPIVLNQGARVIAQIATNLRRVDATGRGLPSSPGFPKKLSPAMIPAPGQSQVIDVEFLTATLSPGEYEVEFQLQSPSGTRVGRVTTMLTVNENLAVTDLIEFERVRTEQRRGADTYVASGSDTGFGAGPYLEIHQPVKKPEQTEPAKHAYLRFDLGPWASQRDRIDRAMLLLTLDSGGHKGKATLTAYGVTQLMSADWAEKGEGEIKWVTSPSAGEIESYPFLGRVELDNSGGQLERQADAIRLFGRGLDDYLRGNNGEFVTILLVQTNTADQPLRVVSREGKADESPALALRAGP